MLSARGPLNCGAAGTKAKQAPQSGWEYSEEEGLPRGPEFKTGQGTVL